MEPGVGRLLSTTERDGVGGGLRTAFLISPRYALTAWHCLTDLGGLEARAWLRLAGLPDISQRYVDVPVQYLTHDSSLDVALLLIDYDRYSHPELPEQIEVALSQAVVPLAIKVTDHDEVSVQGFPERNVNPDGVALRALIGDVKAPFKQTDCLRLELPSLAASVPELPKGLSGGPVLRSLDGKMVAVGVIRSFPVIHSRSEKLPLGGELLASRIADIATAIPQVAESLYQCAWLFASARPRRRGRLSRRVFCVPLRRSCLSGPRCRARRLAGVVPGDGQCELAAGEGVRRTRQDPAGP